MHEYYTRVAPDPDHFEQFQLKLSTMVATFDGWSADDLRAVRAPTLIIVGDTDLVRVEHNAEMRELIPNAQLAVVPGTTHTQLMRRTDLLVAILANFL